MSDPTKPITRQPTVDSSIWVSMPDLATEQVDDELEVPGKVSVRPRTLAEYVGQQKLKEAIEISINATKRRGEALDHVLLHGPPGLGKTSMARIIAEELGVTCKTTAGPVIERPGDLAAILTSLSAHDVLFIDEIHRLPRVVEEVLYPAMEDFEIDIVVGQGPAAKSVKIPLKPFTLIGATTRTGLLTSPLRDRFGMVFRLEFYTKEELTTIVTRAARLLQVPIENAAAVEIGQRARGTPRIANRLLRRLRDFAEEKAGGTITLEVAKHGLQLMEVDERGLDRMDKQILATIADKFAGGPVGIETIAAAIGEESHTLEDVYEPFLIQEGLLARTRRGREITAGGLAVLGRSPLPGQQIGMKFE